MMMNSMLRPFGVYIENGDSNLLYLEWRMRRVDENSRTRRYSASALNKKKKEAASIDEIENVSDEKRKVRAIRCGVVSVIRIPPGLLSSRSIERPAILFLFHHLYDILLA